MTATKKTLFIIQNHGQYPNFFIKTLYTIFSQQQVDPYCLIVMDFTNHVLYSNIYQKIIFFIQTHFIDYLNQKKLIIINNTNSLDIPTLLQNNHLTNYDFYLPIECQNIYFHNYAKNIIDFMSNNHIQKIDVKSTYTININNTINNECITKDSAYTKQEIFQTNNTKPTSYTSQDYLPFVCYAKEKYNVIDQDFQLIWTEEQNQNILKSSYVFIYKKHNKVFNISNNIHGLLESIEENQIIINWYIDTVYKQYSYELSDNNLYINIKYE